MSILATRSQPVEPSKGIPALPVRFWVGVVFVACWWPIAWLQIRPLSDNYFFPLWLGYILTVDGLVYRRTGTSLIARSGWHVAYLFALSIPLWWIFEALNLRLNNWVYHLPTEYSALSYALRASLAFSTVIPAVLVTSELVRSLRFNPLRRLPVLRLPARALVILHLSGWLMLLAVLVLPSLAFPLVWIALFFIVDPVVTALKGRSIGAFLREGDWSAAFNVAAGTVVCGFFWEFWNLYAMPKWTYHLPYAEWFRIFEMPILGYGGYIPFGLEILAICGLAQALMPWISWPRARVSSVEAN